MTTERELEEAAWRACEKATRYWLSRDLNTHDPEPFRRANDALRALDAHRAAARDEALVERMHSAYDDAFFGVVNPPGVEKRHNRDAGLRAVLALLEREGWKRP